MNYLVGLTGGIGSGKSTVANMFAALGVRIIDTDVISRQLTQAGGEAIPALLAAFGPHVVNDQNALDRNRMRELVFGNPGERKRLESILHPLILTHVRQQAAEYTDAPYTLIVVPLLFESGGYASWLQRVIAVDCPEQAQIARTTQRSGLDESTVRAIMAQQLSRHERCRLADEVLRNDGGLDDLNEQVIGMHRHLSALAAESD